MNHCQLVLLIQPNRVFDFQQEFYIYIYIYSYYLIVGNVELRLTSAGSALSLVFENHRLVAIHGSSYCQETWLIQNDKI